MKKYFIKVIGKTFFETYAIKTENLFFAKMLALNNFIKDYPNEKNTTNLQRVSVTGKII